MLELCSAAWLKRDIEGRYGGKIEERLIGGQPKEKFTLQVGRVPDKVSGWNESYYTEAGDEYTKFNMVSKDDLLARQRSETGVNNLAVADPVVVGISELSAERARRRSDFGASTSTCVLVTSWIVVI